MQPPNSGRQLKAFLFGQSGMLWAVERGRDGVLQGSGSRGV
jgi:hypothetical protein